MHCIPFLPCSIFLTVAAPFYDGHRIPAVLFLLFLPIFPHGSAENCISCSLDTHRLISTNEPGPGFFSGRKQKKRIENFIYFLRPRREKLDHQVCIRKVIQFHRVTYVLSLIPYLWVKLLKIYLLFRHYSPTLQKINIFGSMTS